MPDLNEEYRTATTGAGWFDRQVLGRLAFEGRDATSFLHALVSADIAGVPEGGGAYATYLTPQGRMITDLTLYRLARRWLAVVPDGQAAALATRFDSVIFTEDVSVSDVSAAIGQISVVGPAASVAIGRATGTDASHLEALGTHGHLEKNGVTIARTDAAIIPTFDVFAAADRVPALTATLTEKGARPLHAPTDDVLRIEAGRPRFGVDMTTETIPLEAGLLDRAISQTKGCYVGQEIIIRVLHRGGGRVAKRLMRLEATQGVELAAVPVGAAIVADGHEVGHVTSAAWSPGRGRVVALGYVQRAAGDTGGILIKASGNESTARIVGTAG